MMAARVLFGCIAAALGGAASAHGGHEVPPGVAADAHFHVFDGVLVPPGWLLMLVLAVIAALFALRRARRDRATRARTDDRRRAGNA
jgi:hypothetical protein